MTRHQDQHLGECARCRALIGATPADDASEPISPVTVNRIQAAILADLVPVRPLLPAGVFFVIFAAIFCVLAGAGVHRLSNYGWEYLESAQRAVIFASIGASAALLGVSLVAQMTPGSRHRLSPKLLPAGVFVLLLLVLVGTFQYVREPHFFQAGVACLKAGTPYSVLAALAFWLVLRQGVVFSRRIAAAGAGSLAGLVAITVLEVHCPNFNVMHIVTFHLGMLVMGAVVGLLLCIGVDSLCPANRLLR